MLMTRVLAVLVAIMFGSIMTKLAPVLVATLVIVPSLVGAGSKMAGGAFFRAAWKTFLWTLLALVVIVGLMAFASMGNGIH